MDTSAPVRNQRRYKHQAIPAHENVGIDSETFQGRAKIITDSYNRVIEPENFYAILQFLSYYKYKTRFNWFWNVQFDFEAIIKWLAYENYGLVKALYFNKFIKYRNYTISYLPGKYFRIEDNHNNSYRFYDMHNFIPLKLEEAARKYLKDSKLSEVDSSRLNKDPDYWTENKDLIIEYCKKNSKLTKELADYFWNKMSETLNFNPGKPFSKGSYSQEYFLDRCFIPQLTNIKPREVIEYAYKSCRGGRFELLKRGYNEHIYEYDIKSAYSGGMVTLPAFTNGKWLYQTDFNEDYDYGFYKCKVVTFNEILAPLWYQKNHKGLISYPNGSFEIYLGHDEIRTVLSIFPETEIEVIDGWAFHPEYKYEYPLKKENERLFKLKEHEKQPEIKEMYKAVLNSLSGKFLQEIGGTQGKLFNPLWYSLTTSWARCRLLEMAARLGFENIISFSQDAIHSTNKVYLKKPGLGDFELESDDWQGIYLMSDIYSMWKDQTSKHKMRGYITEVRDPAIKKKKYSLLDIINNMNGSTIFEWTDTRPVHLGEIIQQKHNWNINDLNIWQNIPRRLDINGDHKRIWSKQFQSSKELFISSHSSRPLVIQNA